MNKIILYYQSFIGLEKIYNEDDVYVTNIHLSSLHFGPNDDNSSYIHLNNLSPYSSKFNKVWDDLVKCKKKGIKIIIMLGGAGGAYNYMFKNNETYLECLNLLLKLINDKEDIIDGIDLDVEEEIGLDNILKLIRDLNAKLPKNFIFSMAPVSDYLISDSPGMGGFKYSDIIKSDVGNRIDYFNGQFYDYSIFEETTLTDIYNMCTKVIPREKLVLGIEYISSDFYDELYSITVSKPISGVYFWEYVNMPDGFVENIYFILNHKNINTSYNVGCSIS